MPAFLSLQRIGQPILWQLGPFSISTEDTAHTPFLPTPSGKSLMYWQPPTARRVWAVASWPNIHFLLSKFQHYLVLLLHVLSGTWVVASWLAGLVVHYVPAYPPLPEPGIAQAGEAGGMLQSPILAFCLILHKCLRILAQRYYHPHFLSWEFISCPCEGWLVNSAWVEWKAMIRDVHIEIR